MTIHLNKQFQRAIDNNPRNCILFVGAGLSSSHVRKNNKGLPTWHHLIKAMIDELKDAQKCNQSKLNELSDLFSKKRYLKVAQIFKERTRSDQYAAFLKEQLDPSDLKKSEIHKLILSINFKGIITTNFDCVFENQNNRIQPLIYPQGFEDIQAFRRDGFFAKIHGCIRNTPNPAENLVLSEESYLYLRKNIKYQTILKSLFLLHPILTVGFSLNDPDFLGLIEDIKEIFGNSMPTIYSLMSIDDEIIRNEWRKQGIEIISYEKHSELYEFFNELKKLSDFKNNLTNINIMEKESEIDYDEYFINDSGQSSIENFENILEKQIEKFSSSKDRETFLVRLKSMIEPIYTILLTPYLCKLGTPICNRILHSIFQEFAQRDSYDMERMARPRHKLVNVHIWLLNNLDIYLKKDSKYFWADSEVLFNWLLQSDWAEHNIDLWNTFIRILNLIISNNVEMELYGLFKASDKIEGARDKIEQIVLKKDFISIATSKGKWSETNFKQTVADIQFCKFENKIKNEGSTNYLNHLEEALKNDDYRFHELVLKRIFDNFSQLTCLSLHGSNSNYNPSEARKILDALAEISSSDWQMDVLRAIEQFVEDERNHGRFSEIGINLIDELLYPLYWRYSNDTRIEFTMHSYMRKFHKGGTLHSGQNFLLNRFLGLTYDIDKDFVNEFNNSLDRHKHKINNNVEKYEPRPLQEIWSYRILKYLSSDEIPPELIRQFAVFRVEWDYMEKSEIRWKEAKAEAEKSYNKETLNRFFSKKNKNIILDNLLGYYSPNTFTITLYPKMIEFIATELEVDSQSLGTITYIHLTIHAYCHIAKDLNDWYWTDFSLPVPEQPVLNFSKTIETIAQFYTFKLIEYLQDIKLMKAFIEFEKHSDDVYREWRRIENYTLEDVRTILIKYRKMTNDFTDLKII